MKAKLKDGLVDGEYYGSLFFCEEMRFEGFKDTGELSRNGNYEICDWYYTPEMLEFEAKVSEEIKAHIDKLNPAYRAKYPDALGWGWPNNFYIKVSNNAKDENDLDLLRFIVDKDLFVPYSCEESDLDGPLRNHKFYTICDYQGDSLTTKAFKTQIKSDDEKYNNHDEHYKQQIEPIDILDQISKNLENTTLTAVQKKDYLFGLKYFLRIGTKDDALKEINKGQNYINRVLTGEFR